MQTESLCQCSMCLEGVEHPNRLTHQQINLLLSRLDEQQRRWFAAFEANRMGQGGVRLLSEITGMDEKTIYRGQMELAGWLKDRPTQRIRLPGAGRPRLKKRISWEASNDEEMSF